MKQKGFLRTFIIILVVLLNVAVDQVTKVIVRNNVEPRSYTEIIGPYFTMTNVENTGAFLSLGENLNPFLKGLILMGLPVLALIAMVGYIIVKPVNMALAIAIASIVGGGIGNIYDRAVYGSVTDFFHIRFSGLLQTGIFNIADVSVMVGAGVVLLYSLSNKKASTE